MELDRLAVVLGAGDPLLAVRLAGHHAKAAVVRPDVVPGDRRRNGLPPARGHVRNFRQVLERMELDPLAVVLGFRDLPFAPRLVRGRPLLVVVRAVVVLRRGNGGLYVDRTRVAGRLLDDVLADLDLDLRRLASGLKPGDDVLLVDGAALRDVPGPLLCPSGLDCLLDVHLRALVLWLRLAPVRDVRDRGVRVDGRSARARLPDDADGLVRSVGLRPVP